MELNDKLLLDCVCYLEEYNFSSMINYRIRGETIFVEVIPDKNKLDFFANSKWVSLTLDEYNQFIRNKKLNKLKNKI